MIQPRVCISQLAQALGIDADGCTSAELELDSRNSQLNDEKSAERTFEPVIVEEQIPIYSNL